MNKNLLLTISILLSACSQPNQNKQTTVPEKVESKVIRDNENPTIEKQVFADQPLVTFAYQETPDERLSTHCVWTDDANAEGKIYWAILPSDTTNGKSRFTKDDIDPVKIKIGKLIKNCNPAYKNEKANFAYEINDERDWNNAIGLKTDRLIKNDDQTYTIDLNKNGKADKIYTCLNMESINVFFKDDDKIQPLLHTNIMLSYELDSNIDPEIACGEVFYKKSGIVAKEDAQTGEYTYSVR